MRMRRRDLLAAGAAAGTAAGLGGGAGPAGPATAAIRIALDRPGRPVPPRLFGSNLQWDDAGDGTLVPDGAGGWTWAPGLAGQLRPSGLTFLRFPGGSLANTYVWTAGTGPRAARPPGLSYAGTPAPSVFGTDELIALSALAGFTETMLTVNLSAGEAAACDWIDYVTRTGPAPHLLVPFVEVGNELFAAREHGTLPAAEYGARAAAFARAIHARCPGVKVGAMLEASFQFAAWMPTALPNLVAWNEQVLRAAGPDIDFVSVHFGAPYDTLWFTSNLRELVWSAPLVLAETLAGIGQLAGRLGRPGLPVVMSEYTTFFGGSSVPDGRVSGTENALFDALCLFTAMRDPGVAAAANWSLANNANFGLLRSDASGRLQPRPNFAVLHALSALAGRPLLPLRIDSPSYAVAAKGNVPALPQVPMLDGVAVGGGDAIAVALVNRSARQAVPVELCAERSLTARDGAILVAADGAGTRWDAPSVPAPVRTQSGGLRYELPPGSFTTLTLAAA